MSRPAVALGLALAASIAIAACDSRDVGIVPTGQPSTSSRTNVLLAQLRVAAEDMSREYRRAEFGPRWKDVDGNGCNTRDDVLRRDLTDITIEGRCDVVAGTLADPYTGRTVTLTKSTPGAVQIDHVVSLKAAWVAGAADWTKTKRTAFANDPANLLAVGGPTNTSKGDRGPEEWNPRDRAASCDYVTRYINVKAAYSLSVTRDERHTLRVTHEGSCNP